MIMVPKPTALTAAYTATYDAWNRLVEVKSGANMVLKRACDGLGRRIAKEVKNSADRDYTYHHYYDRSWRRIEVRDGSDNVLKQYVWGTRYIDNIVQIGINTDPEDDEEGPQSNQCLCEDFYYPVQDANFNVVGLVDSSGSLKERYEYTPYGQRTVYMKAGSDDKKTSAPLYESRRVKVGSIEQPYGLCDIGHQGLFLDTEFGLYDNRRRVLYPRLGRFLQRDPIGYADGMGLYEYVGSSPPVYPDPMGMGPPVVVPKDLLANFKRNVKPLWDWLFGGSSGCQKIREWLDENKNATYGSWKRGISVTKQGQCEYDPIDIREPFSRPPGIAVRDGGRAGYGAKKTPLEKSQAARGPRAQATPPVPAITSKALDRAWSTAGAREPHQRVEERARGYTKGAAKGAAAALSADALGGVGRAADEILSAPSKAVFYGWKDCGCAGYYVNTISGKEEMDKNAKEGRGLLYDWCGISIGR